MPPTTAGEALFRWFYRERPRVWHDWQDAGPEFRTQWQAWAQLIVDADRRAVTTARPLIEVADR